MTVIRIPPLQDSAGGRIDAVCKISLVDGDDQPLIAFCPQALLTEQRELVLVDAIDVPLVPQADIGVPGAAASWYLIQIISRYRGANYRVRVPRSDAVLDLEALVGAEAIAGHDLAAQLVSDVRAAAGVVEGAAASAVAAAGAAATSAAGAGQAAGAAATSAAGAGQAAVAAAAGAASAVPAAAAAAASAVAAGGSAEASAGSAAAAAEAETASAWFADYINRSVSGALVFVSATENGVTLGVGSEVLVSTGLSPYPHVVLRIQTPGTPDGRLTFVTPPSTSQSAGTRGQVAWSAPYFFVVVDNAHWARRAPETQWAEGGGAPAPISPGTVGDELLIDGYWYLCRLPARWVRFVVETAFQDAPELNHDLYGQWADDYWYRWVGDAAEPVRLAMEDTF